MEVLNGGSAVLSMDAGSKATVTFTRTGINRIGNRDAWSGIAKVYVDGNILATVDTFAANDAANAVVYSVSNLSVGGHTLIIEVTGQKSGASGGAWIWVDALDATP